MSEEKLPLGFLASSSKCGLKNNDYDLALILSEPPSLVSAMYTKNSFASHPVVYSKKHDKNKIKALIINSKNANALNGNKGYEDLITTLKASENILQCKKENILVASTGTVGIPLETEKIIKGIEMAAKSLDSYPGCIAKAIQMRDKYEKTYNTTLEMDSKTAHFFAMAKGTSLVHPNMATVLLFIFTDLNIEKNAMNSIFKETINKTLNRISVDAASSTNDSAMFFANGALNNKLITEKTKKNYEALKLKLEEICSNLAKLIVEDGEGSTKTITVKVKRAKTQKEAYETAKYIATSNIIKISFSSNESNVYKILSILGNLNINVDKLSLYINSIEVFKNGKIKETAENIKAVKESIRERKNDILIDLGYNTKYEDYYYFADISKEYISVHTSYEI